MQPLTMRLFLISILLVGLASCKTYQPAGVITSEVQKTTYQNNYFSGDSAYLYKAQVEVYGNQLSGILVIKKIAEFTHRVALTSAFGNTLLDVTISENEMKINSILEELNRKILLKTLETDFRMILTNQHLIQEKLETDKDFIYKSKTKGGNYYFFNSKEEEYLRQISLASKSKEKVKVNITSKNRTFAENIIIQHYNIKLRIELSEYKNE